MDKSIKMSEDTWKKLNKLKYSLGAKSMDQVIQALMKIATKTRVVEELEK